MEVEQFERLITKAAGSLLLLHFVLAFISFLCLVVGATLSVLMYVTLTDQIGMRDVRLSEQAEKIAEQQVYIDYLYRQSKQELSSDSEGDEE